jgi:transposase
LRSLVYVGCRRYPVQRDHTTVLQAPDCPGKPPKVALITRMRKLLVILNAMLKSQQPWRSDVASLERASAV